MLRAPIKHFPFNTWDAFYFILYLLYAIVMTPVWFSTATEEILPVSFMPKYYKCLSQDPWNGHVFIFDLYNAPKS